MPPVRLWKRHCHSRFRTHPTHIHTRTCTQTRSWMQMRKILNTHVRVLLFIGCILFDVADIEGHLATHLGRTNISGLLGNIGVVLELAARECLF